MHFEVCYNTFVNKTKATFLIATFANSYTATENLTAKGANIGTIVQMPQ